MRASIGLLLVACSALAACSATTLNGTVVNCATRKPLEGVSLKIVEAPKDPNARPTSSGFNYYRTGTKKDGTFVVTAASSDPAPWEVQAAMAGYEPAFARYEIGVKTQTFCLKPK
jgi:hypothetical protein